VSSPPACHYDETALNHFRNYGILIAFIISFTIAYLLAAEYIHMDRSKGEVLVFRRGYKPKSTTASAPDEESRGTDLVGESQKLEHTVTHTRDEPSLGIQKQTSVFHWRDVSYDITIKGEHRRILNSVDGWVRPGTLTALMVTVPLPSS